MKTKGHHGHAFCGSTCVPHFLHEEFNGCLGDHGDEFDLLMWYPKRDQQRQREMRVIAEPLTWWREAFRAELAARGWIQPRKFQQKKTTEPTRQGVSPRGIVYPCPHAPSCRSTWECGIKQLAANHGIGVRA